MIRKCCCCSLKIGCYIIGTLYIICQLWEIALHSIEIHWVSEEDEREDQENKDQRTRIVIRQSLWIVTAILLMFMGVIIIVAAVREWSLALKISSVIMGVMAVIVFLFYMISIGKVMTPFVVIKRLIPLALLIYFSVMLWLTAIYFDNGGDEVSTGRVYYETPTDSGQNTAPATPGYQGQYYPPTAYDPYQNPYYSQYPYAGNYPQNYPQYPYAGNYPPPNYNSWYQNNNPVNRNVHLDK